MAKPYILDPPVPLTLEQIAAGAKVVPPYVLHPSPGLPAIENANPTILLEGSKFPVRLTLLGQTVPLLPRLIELLAGETLQIGQGRFLLVRAIDTVPSRRVLYDRALAARPVQAPSIQRLTDQQSNLGHKLRLSFVTPARLRAGTAYAFDGPEFAHLFWQAALARAVRIRDDFCALGEQRVPWQKLPDDMPRVRRLKLYRYRLERLSHRQQRLMDFDGVIGSVDYEDNLEQLAPLVAAAEILHIGQKATFGLGRVSAFWTD